MSYPVLHVSSYHEIASFLIAEGFIWKTLPPDIHQECSCQKGLNMFVEKSIWGPDEFRTASKLKCFRPTKPSEDRDSWKHVQYLFDIKDLEGTESIKFLNDYSDQSRRKLLTS